MVGIQVKGEERSCEQRRSEEGDRQHDRGGGRVGILPRRDQLHANRQTGAEEACPLHDELCQVQA